MSIGSVDRLTRNSSQSLCSHSSRETKTKKRKKRLLWIGIVREATSCLFEGGLIHSIHFNLRNKMKLDKMLWVRFGGFGTDSPWTFSSSFQIFTSLRFHYKLFGIRHFFECNKFQYVLIVILHSSFFFFFFFCARRNSFWFFLLRFASVSYARCKHCKHCHPRITANISFCM